MPGAAPSRLTQLALGGACLALSLVARADGLPAEVTQALLAAKLPAEAVSVVVQPLDTGAPRLVEHNPRQAMNPASVMKLLTTYAALDILGPNWTWKTGLWLERPPADGRLPGNLYLKGGGDPRFAVEHLTALLRQARTRGVRHIAGDIVLDRGAFAVPAGDPGAFDDKPMRPYNVGPDALLINFRTLAFTLQPAPGKPRLLLETPSDGLAIDNRLQSGDGPCTSDWKDALRIQLKSEGNSQRLEFAGTYPTLCGERSLNLAPLAADLHGAGMIRAIWRELGGSLDGQVRAGTTPAAARLFAQHESAPVADVVRDINKFSNNVMARQLFLALGSENGEPATVERARRRLADWLNERALAFPELEVENGSGLSRRERLSADSLTRLLMDAWNHPFMPELMASLPITGTDGTMKKRLAASAASGRAHIKTGTLDGVRSAAGYALDSQGRRYAVTFLINHPRAQAGGPAIDALLLWVARLPGGSLPQLVAK